MKQTLSDFSTSGGDQKISVFGNPMIPIDSLPIRIIPLLEEEFPHIRFAVEDPTEYLDGNGESEWWMLDTVDGIEDVAIFDDIIRFDAPKTVSVHDYDLALDLQIMNKLGKIKKVKVIGISPRLSEKQAFKKVTTLLRKNGF